MHTLSPSSLNPMCVHVSQQISAVHVDGIIPQVGALFQSDLLSQRLRCGYLSVEEGGKHIKVPGYDGGSDIISIAGEKAIM